MAIHTNAEIDTNINIINNKIMSNYRIQQLLTKEGNIGYISTYASFSDGTFNDITNNPAVTYTSLDTYISTGIDINGPIMTLLPGILSMNKSIIQASYQVCGTISTGLGLVVVKLPDVKNAILSSNVPSITKSNDPTVFAPFSYSLEAIISINVIYVDDSSKSFTTPSYDSRAVLTIVSGSNLAYLQNNKLYAKENLLNFGDHVIIKVTFPGLYGISANITIGIVGFASLTVKTITYPLCGSSMLKNVLQYLGCSGVYQRIYAVVIGTLTDGSFRDLTSYSTYYSNNSGVAEFVKNSSPIIIGISVGVTGISATYHGITTFPLFPVIVLLLDAM